MGFSGGLATIYDGATVHPHKPQYTKCFEISSKITYAFECL